MAALTALLKMPVRKLAALLRALSAKIFLVQPAVAAIITRAIVIRIVGRALRMIVTPSCRSYRTLGGAA